MFSKIVLCVILAGVVITAVIVAIVIMWFFVRALGPPKCPKCGTFGINSITYKFCSKCGYDFRPKKCSNCGEEVSKEDKYCYCCKNPL